MLFHRKLGWGGGGPLLSPTDNPVVKCHTLNIAKVCVCMWGMAKFRKHSSSYRLTGSILISPIFSEQSFSVAEQNFLSHQLASIFFLTLNDAAQNFPHKAGDAGELRRFNSSAVRGG